MGSSTSIERVKQLWKVKPFNAWLLGSLDAKDYIRANDMLHQKNTESHSALEVIEYIPAWKILLRTSTPNPISVYEILLHFIWC